MGVTLIHKIVEGSEKMIELASGSLFLVIYQVIDLLLIFFC